MKGYVTITSHHIDMDLKMKSFVLQTRILNKAHSGKNIGYYCAKPAQKGESPIVSSRLLKEKLM